MRSGCRVCRGGGSLEVGKGIHNKDEGPRYRWVVSATGNALHTERRLRWGAARVARVSSSSLEMRDGQYHHSSCV